MSRMNKTMNRYSPEVRHSSIDIHFSKIFPAATTGVRWIRMFSSIIQFGNVWTPKISLARESQIQVPRIEFKRCSGTFRTLQKSDLGRDKIFRMHQRTPFLEPGGGNQAGALNCHRPGFRQHNRPGVTFCTFGRTLGKPVVEASHAPNMPSRLNTDNFTSRSQRLANCQTAPLEFDC